jgi:predicted ATP-binding protein involved in virulence
MKEPVYFLKVELENIRCFKEKVILDLSDGNGHWKKWTVILGDNGLGKTSILQAIASLEIIRRKDLDGTYSFSLRDGFSRKKGQPNLKIAAEVFKSNTKAQQNKNFERDIEIASHGIGARSYGGNYYMSSKKDHIMSIYSYGANRVMGSSSLMDTFSEDNSETLFDDTKSLINAEEWLLQLDYAASKESEVKAFAEQKRNQVKQTLIDLLPDVSDIRFTTPVKDNLKSSVEFKTSFGWFSLQELSLGYRSMIAWMVDLAARMFKSNPDSENPLAEPAIVLVDEIDLHLHPKWQRIMFEYLSEKFPATQFIVTAHSPLVVQSAPQEVNIVVLRKEKDHVIIDNNIRSVQNWRLDQILTSDLFGIESSRNNQIEIYLEERKKLLQLEKLTSDEENRLLELNGLVHRLPTADNLQDIEAMEIIRKAADLLKKKKS